MQDTCFFNRTSQTWKGFWWMRHTTILNCNKSLFCSFELSGFYQLHFLMPCLLCWPTLSDQYEKKPWKMKAIIVKVFIHFWSPGMNFSHLRSNLLLLKSGFATITFFSQYHFLKLRWLTMYYSQPMVSIKWVFLAFSRTSDTKTPQLNLSRNKNFDYRIVQEEKLFKR